jgi:hypothetical protein
MEKWVKEAEKQDEKNFDMGEFIEFRSYINQVKDIGCVLGYKTFKEFQGSKEAPPKYR